MNKLLGKHGNKPLFYQFFRKMKLTIFIVTISILSGLSAESYSQSTRLNLTENNSTLLNVLRAIEEKSEFKFFYNEKVDVNKAVSVDVFQKTITEILDNVLANTSVKYKVLGRQIALYDNKEMEPFVSEQQGKKITGKVSDATGGSLPGVSVVIKGTTTGIITDISGNYSLNNVPDNATLQFSFVGMKSVEVKVGSQATINVVLEDETIGIEEVVAIGYGTAKKRDVTGAVGSVKAEAIVRSNPIQPAKALQGQLAGVNVNKVNSRPGSDYTIDIRGVHSISFSSEPLMA